MRWMVWGAAMLLIPSVGAAQHVIPLDLDGDGVDEFVQVGVEAEHVVVSVKTLQGKVLTTQRLDQGRWPCLNGFKSPSYETLNCEQTTPIATRFVLDGRLLADGAAAPRDLASGARGRAPGTVALQGKSGFALGFAAEGGGPWSRGTEVVLATDDGWKVLGLGVGSAETSATPVDTNGSGEADALRIKVPAAQRCGSVDTVAVPAQMGGSGWSAVGVTDALLESESGREWARSSGLFAPDSDDCALVAGQKAELRKALDAGDAAQVAAWFDILRAPRLENPGTYRLRCSVSLGAALTESLSERPDLRLRVEIGGTTVYDSYDAKTIARDQSSAEWSFPFNWERGQKVMFRVEDHEGDMFWVKQHKLIEVSYDAPEAMPLVGPTDVKALLGKLGEGTELTWEVLEAP